MREVTIKKKEEIQLKGIHYELLMIDNNIKGITIRDGEGNYITAKYEGYSFQLTKQAPPVTVTKYKVSGTVLDIPVEHIADSEYDARQIVSRYSERVYRDGDADLTISPVEVVVPE